jgi:hypothetical protein
VRTWRYRVWRNFAAASPVVARPAAPRYYGHRGYHAVAHRYSAPARSTMMHRYRGRHRS